jgi:uncharacterized protein
MSPRSTLCQPRGAVCLALAHTFAPLPLLSFQSLTNCLKLNYPMRIVHPERSEGSLYLSSINFQQLARCLKFATLSEPLSFQSLPTIKFCNPFVLITIRNGEGVRTPSHALLKHYLRSPDSFSCPSLTSLYPYFLASLPRRGLDAKMLELQERNGAVVLQVRVQPRASKDEIAGEMGGALKVRLQAPAVENRANDALIEFLAQLLKTPKSAVRILSGDRSRTKRLEIHGVTAQQIQSLLIEEA